MPPILEVFVVWHAEDDRVGQWAARTLGEHFHGTAFAGLAGGAVEVYVRTEGWERPGGAPRPLPFDHRLPHDLPTAQFTALVPVLGRGMARAFEEDDDWAAYVTSIFAARGRPGVGVYPLAVPRADLTGSGLAHVARAAQTLPAESGSEASTLCRELSQAITQDLQEVRGDARRITVFVSHTKHRSLAEHDEDGPRLFDAVRDVVLRTRLKHFFDATDLQTGREWEEELDTAAGRSALLMVRTDRYGEREWTQREVHTAKRHDLPIVTMYALRTGEERGSFLMDHVPAVPCDIADPVPGITRALNRLVDESLKRALWLAQAVYLTDQGFDWLPVHAPEPVTTIPWLLRNGVERGRGGELRIMHPDPPLGPKEHDCIVELCTLARIEADVQIFTPRTLAARGGQVRP